LSLKQKTKSKQLTGCFINYINYQTAKQGHLFTKLSFYKALLKPSLILKIIEGFFFWKAFSFGRLFLLEGFFFWKAFSFGRLFLLEGFFFWKAFLLLAFTLQRHYNNKVVKQFKLGGLKCTKEKRKGHEDS
jgi:hypothetical protein